MVVIRLARGGSKKRPFYNVVVTGSRMRRDSHSIERLGYYNPVAAGADVRLHFEEDRVNYWLSKGAQMSDTVARLFKNRVALAAPESAEEKAATAAKNAAKKAVKDISRELIALYAKRKASKGFAFTPDSYLQHELEASFQWEDTPDQQTTVAAVKKDMESDQPMDRLVCGDVGFGKTEVAIRAAFKAAVDGKQVAVLVPTTILALQHYRSFSERLRDFPVRVEYLNRTKTAKEAGQIRADLESGRIDILIGTHKILGKQIKFRDLGLLIIDEEQKFGVAAKEKLTQMAVNVDTLTLTATPIPRTLAVVLYGDLDVSVLDEMPPGRQVIKTRNVAGEKREACYDFVEKQLQQGRQAYVVTPLIEDSDTLDLKSAQTVYEELAKRFAEYKVALIHGSMKQVEKDQVMQEFYRGEIDVLVATVVIEVGINVPNASVIVIENAERFGLAQLHQLRGRVGRGRWQSYCFLITQSQSELAQKRGEIMQSSSDGFFIAEEDMKLRGPGDIFGTRQHGIPELNVADLAKHLKIMEHARQEAKKILAEDPLLQKEENAELKRRITKLFGEDMSLNL